MGCRNRFDHPRGCVVLGSGASICSGRARRLLTPVPRRRLDVELVRRRLADSRTEAERLIIAGRVLVDGSVGDKCARLVGADQAVLVNAKPDRFVSRGGDKLNHAMERFAVAVDGQPCIDVGASTGGFTDCLLQRGASSVVAVDSGHGQFHSRLRNDHRVTVLEHTNARHLLDVRPDLRGSASLVVADVSFISLTVLVPTLVACAAESDGSLILLVKPQFEVGRVEASRGRGVVRQPSQRLAAVERVVEALGHAGARTVSATASPLLGPAGNAEFFLHARRSAAPDACRRAAPAEGETGVTSPVSSGSGTCSRPGSTPLGSNAMSACSPAQPEANHVQAILRAAVAEAPDAESDPRADPVEPVQ